MISLIQAIATVAAASTDTDRPTDTGAFTSSAAEEPANSAGWVTKVKVRYSTYAKRSTTESETLSRPRPSAVIPSAAGVDSVQDGNQMSSFDRVVTVTIPREVAFDLNAHRSQVDRPGGSMHSGRGMRVSSIIQPRIRRSFSAGSADRSRNGRWGGWVKGALMTKTALVGLYLAIAIVLPVVGAHADGGWVAIARDGSGYWGYANDYPDSRSAASAALRGCGHGGCKLAFSERANCLAYAESRAGGYWDAYA
jgi:hypothetical protein